MAETYHNLRPRYFAPLLDPAQEALELASPACVLDLGAGTGRLTRELILRFANVVAVEPEEEMRRLIRGATVLAGTAEAIPLDEASVDAVFVGEVFHWVDPGRAIAEIARVLRPRGGLAVISTHWWETSPALPQHVVELLREPSRRTSDQRRPPFQAAFEASPFEPLRSERFEEAITVDADRLLALYSTTSALAALDSEERTALLVEARRQLDGSYHLPIKHTLNWTRLA